VDARGYTVQRLSPDGKITAVAGGTTGAGGDGGRAERAELNIPRGLAVDHNGNLFIADTGNHRIRRVGVDGVITTIAGNGQAGNSGNGGPAIAATLRTPSAVAVDATGNVYIVDGGTSVRWVSPDGIIHDTGYQGHPQGISVDTHGNILVAAEEMIVKLTPFKP
jgi:sugar lactone lactonase YvrE